MTRYIPIGNVEFRLDMIARALGIPASTLASLRAGTHVVVPRKLLTEAHACMRATGWQLAPVSEMDGDGILQLAVAEVEEQFSDLLAAAPEADSRE